MFKVGDRVKVDLKILEDVADGSEYTKFKDEYPNTTDYLRRNSDKFFTIVGLTERFGKPRFRLDVVGDCGYISTYEGKYLIPEFAFKNGSQVKLNHAVLEKRIRELDLAFVGHSKLNPNFIYTVLEKAENGMYLVIFYGDAYVHHEFFNGNELILVDGE